MMPREAFIPNDVLLDEAARVILLTGPNMAGKSTLLRQVGLCVLLAQMGAFVPARRAVVGVVDRLFTRVGASDNLVAGHCRFMVEMSETCAIFHGATARSLILLDEIGRGTSTYDGVAIAWAVTEFLHNTLGAKTIFATHYHELTQLTEELAHARNFNVAVREVGDEIVFLHRLEPGGAARSYGIHVGRPAGLPTAVVPPALFDQEVEGDVVLRLFVDSTGHLRPESTKVAESSGYPALDSAAVAGAGQLHFAPARRRGLPVSTGFLQPIEFRHPQGQVLKGGPGATAH